MSIGFDLWLRRLLSHDFFFRDEGLRLVDDRLTRIFNLGVDVLIAILILHLFFTLGWTSSFDRLAVLY